jgi:hypothetical protein
MALIVPVLLTLLLGSMELGNYFYNQHTLTKSVRDGARFAARQAFEHFETCDAEPGGTVVADTKQVTRTGQVTGGSDRLPNWTAGDTQFSVTTRCSTESDGVTYGGIYSAFASEGARYVVVEAVLPYQPIMGMLGLASGNLQVHASQQAAVAGI